MQGVQDDRALVRLLAKGQLGALEGLLERHWARAYRIALRVVHEPTLAEDAAQEAFVRLLQQADRFDTQREFVPWFSRVVRNAARDQARKETRRGKHEAEARPSSAEPSQERLEQDEACTVVREHLAQLQPSYRLALTLHYVDGLSFRQVAYALDCPEGTASSRIRRGLESLRRSLTPVLGSSACVLPGFLTVLEEALREEPPAAPSPEALQARRAAVAAALAGASASVRSGGAVPHVLAAAALVAVLATTGWALLGGDPSSPDLPKIVASGSAGTTPENAPPAEPTLPTPGAPELQLGAAAAVPPQPQRPSSGRLVVRVFQERWDGPPLAGGTLELLSWGDEEEDPDEEPGAEFDPEELMLNLDENGTGSVSLARLRQGAPWEATVRWGSGRTADLFQVRLSRGSQTLLEPSPDWYAQTLELGSAEDTAWEGLEAASDVAGELGLAGRVTVNLTPPSGKPDELLLEVLVASDVLLRGRTVAYPSGRPVGRARVNLALTVCQSDAEGYFQLLVPRAELTHGSLTASAAGLAEGKLGVYWGYGLAPPPEQELVITLPLGGTLQGRVVDEDGNPLAGASVNSRPGPRTETGPDGQFVLAGLPPTQGPGHSTVEIWVDAESCALRRRPAVPVGPDGGEVELVLRRAAALSGVVVDMSGNPLRGALVTLVPPETLGSNRFSPGFEDYGGPPEADWELPWDPEWGDPSCEQTGEPYEAERNDPVRDKFAPEEATLRVRASGRFEFPGVARGPHRVLVRARGFASRMIELHTSEEETLSLSASTVLAGQIDPPAPVLVVAYPAGAGGVAGRAREARLCSSSGRFRFTTLPAGRYDLVLRLGDEPARLVPGVEAGEAPLQLKWEGTLPPEIVYEVGPEDQGYFSVDVFDSEGNRVRPLFKGYVSPSDLLVLPGPGAFSLVFRDSGRRPRRRDVSLVSGERLDLGRIALKRGELADLNLHLAYGDLAVERVEVSWLDPDTGLPEERLLAGTLGRPEPYLQRDLNPGPITLRTRVWEVGGDEPPPHELEPIELDLRPGAVTEVTIDLR